MEREEASYYNKLRLPYSLACSLSLPRTGIVCLTWCSNTVLEYRYQYSSTVEYQIAYVQRVPGTVIVHSSARTDGGHRSGFPLIFKTAGWLEKAMFPGSFLSFLVRGQDKTTSKKVGSSFYLFFPTAKWTAQFTGGKLDAGNNWKTRST